MDKNDSEALSRAIWEPRLAEMIEYLKRRGFSDVGAATCARSYIETRVFVARETGQLP